jgi:hypothetical protein
MNIRMNITKAVEVVQKGHADQVILYTDKPSSMPKVTDQPLSVMFPAEINTGADYVLKNFGIDPEVIQ